MFKKTSVFLLIIVLVAVSISFTGCADIREVDDLAYVIGIGLDKGRINKLKVTLKIAKPSVIAAGEAGAESVTYVVVEAPSLFSALNMANSFISKELNLNHAKIIVFSKELAVNGLEDYLYAWSRTREIRPHIFMVVSRDSAEEFLKNSKPVLEVNPGKFYELLLKGYTYTGLFVDSQLHNFQVQVKSGSHQPVLALGGVNIYKAAEDFKEEGTTIEEKELPRPLGIPLEGDFKGGDLHKVADTRSEIMGLAVFDGSKMVGELDGEETLFHLMVSGEFEHTFFSLPDPKFKDKFIIVNLSQGRRPIRRVNMVNNRPEIYVRVTLEGDIVALQSGINYEKIKNMDTLERAYEDYIREGILHYLNRTAREFRSDINGFGREYKMQFAAWKEWEEANWLARYKDAVFHVDVEMNVRRPGLTLRSMPLKSSESRN